ncbi:hypothetical protein ES319_D05G346100v1 [Gossypium barbadense]|uniref:Thioredoxin domain-containing protein n=1 Tax=Gossypium barbadense TaxID=3634 RepID=A0A5J5RKS2_GOSBA|nr:hypothetical protein ES319_D05G346100v1 [Gossypium barbadense]
MKIRGIYISKTINSMELYIKTFPNIPKIQPKVTSFHRATTKRKRMGNKASTAKIIEMQSASQWRAQLEASKQSNKLLVIDFSATWCGPCKWMEPVIEEYANLYADVEFIKIDVDTLEDVARQFKVEAMPTFVLVKKGKEICRLVGAKKTELQKLIEKHRFDN